jgi:hypothetical protein
LAEDPGQLHRLLTRLQSELKPPKEVLYVIDVDALDML